MHCNTGRIAAANYLSTQENTIKICMSALPSNRHHRSNDKCLEGKRENYQVCSAQYCVQQ